MTRDTLSAELFTNGPISEPMDKGLAAFADASDVLEARFADRIIRAPELSRGLVSFQASKSRSVYRWYKFKEAFSADLVEHFLEKYGVRTGHVLDPFAGSGTTLFAASGMGLDATGIELLPIGQRIIAVKKSIDSLSSGAGGDRLNAWLKSKPWRDFGTQKPIPELRITAGAYSEATKASMERYIAALEKEDKPFQDLLLFALLCVLEVVSFTRKDGQYLRWDHRSGRRQGARLFDKGHIPAFDDAISEKLQQIVDDIAQPGAADLFARDVPSGAIVLESGSSLEILPQMPSEHFDAIVTSPPYCNRYDYTRTYALELALLGIDEKRLVEFRQAMLSCTVENRTKDLLALNQKWKMAIEAADAQETLQSLLTYLEDCKAAEMLNNNGIPRMVRGYFYEMACIIQECSRVLKNKARLIMVNDNVRYAGASVPVDLILSDMASRLGFKTEAILVLPQKKGNSSQQMGAHGRAPLRKCVYVWQKL